MLDSDCVRLNLPGPEILFTFDEPFEGPKMQTLTFQTEVSRLGLAPYFIAVLNLWAQATYVQVKEAVNTIETTPATQKAHFGSLKRR